MIGTDDLPFTFIMKNEIEYILKVGHIRLLPKDLLRISMEEPQKYRSKI